MGNSKACSIGLATNIFQERFSRAKNLQSLGIVSEQQFEREMMSSKRDRTTNKNKNSSQSKSHSASPTKKDVKSQGGRSPSDLVKVKRAYKIFSEKEG